MKIKTLLVTACWVGLINLSQAQEDSLSWDLSLSELMDITIASATKSAIRQIETPQAVTVITSKDIERISANNLGELLRGVVGMNVVRIHSSQNVITSRGANAFSPSKLLILIDGQPITPTVFSATWYELLPIGMNDIERLEVIRSPGTIYGASAENGVINIISKKATDDGLKIDAQLAYGQQSMLNGGISVYGKANKLSYRVSGGIYTMDPYTNTEEIEFVPGKPIDHGEQHFNDKKMLNTSTVNVAFSYELENGEISLNAGNNFIGNAQGRIPDRLCFIDIEGNVSFANIGYTFKTGKIKHKLTASTDLVKYTFLQNSSSAQIDEAGLKTTNNTFGYEVSIEANKHTVLLGANYNIEASEETTDIKMLDSNFQDLSRASINFYAQDSWNIHENISVYYGGYLSNHYIAGTNFAPMLAIMHKLDDNNTLRIGTYTSYRNPNIFEHSMLYDQNTGDASKYTFVKDNQNLKAERTTSYEIGFRTQHEKTYLGVDLFVNDVNDGMEWILIDTLGGASRPIYETVNSLNQIIFGIELTARYRINSAIEFEGNATFTTIENSDINYGGGSSFGDNNIGEGRYGAQYTPPFIINFTTKYDWKIFSVNLHYQYTGQHLWQWPSWDSASGLDRLQLKPVVDYGSLNARINARIIKGVTISVEGINLADNLHTEWRGDRSYFGRMVWARITYKLN